MKLKQEHPEMLINFHINPITQEVTAEFTKTNFDKCAAWLRQKGCVFSIKSRQLTNLVEFRQIPVNVAAKITERYNSVRIR
jgi:hypothetical protein